MSIRHKGERPDWIDELISGKRIEWVLYDSNTDKMKVATAEDQKEAIRTALSHGIVPRKTQHAAPRSDSHRRMVMSPSEFERFMERIGAR